MDQFKLIAMRRAILFKNYVADFYKYAFIALLTCSSIFAKAQSSDCPTLTPFCQDLHTSFMPDLCMVDVWAKDFVSKIGDGTDSMDLYTIAFDSLGTEMNRVFESIDGVSHQVRIWIICNADPSVFTSCIVTLDINDNSGECPTRPCPIDPNPWCGYSVITCSTVQGSPEELTGPVAALVDIRKNSQAPRGDNWSNPLVDLDDTVSVVRPANWTIDRMGNIFGIALDPINGDIFFAASDVYDYDFQQFVTVGPPPPAVTGPGGPAGIYRTGFNNINVVQNWVTTRPSYPEPDDFDAIVLNSRRIPNTGNDTTSARSGNGIGNIAFDINSNHLFASNLEDGKLYSINSNRRIKDVLDPWDPYVHSPGLVQPDERIWGLAVYNCAETSRLFFARNARIPNDTPDVDEPKEIWSVAINADGTFGDNIRIELIVDRGDMEKLTDMAFNMDCTELIVSERGDAHSAETMRYIKTNGDWIFDRQFFTGIVDTSNTSRTFGNSSAGGVAVAASEENCVVDAACDQFVYSTINCGDIAADDGNPPPFNCAIYGLQGTDRDGNSLDSLHQTDIYVSIAESDVDSIIRFKSNIGDVGIFNCCCPDEPGRNLIDQGVMAMVAGTITTEDFNVVAETRVALSKGGPLMESMTKGDGLYQFDELEMHYDYKISPSKNSDILDGLSTLDLVFIQRHILGIQSLASPYKIIAADFNRDHQVSALDLVQIRRLILGASSSSDLKSWEFVPQNHNFEDPTRPFNFPQSIELKDLETNRMYQDFIAIKLGDVNGDNSFNKLIENRSDNPVKLQLVIEGSEVSVVVVEDVSLSGFQMALDLPGSANIPTNISSDLLDIGSSNMHSGNNMVSISWHGLEDVELSEGETLFKFEVHEAQVLGDLTLSVDAIASELYTPELQSRDFVIVDQKKLSSTVVFGNSPNPFSNQTAISFFLEEEQDVRFDFFDLSGKLIQSTTQTYPSGYGEFVFNAESGASTGQNVILYSVTTSDFSITDKMILVTE